MLFKNTLLPIIATACLLGNVIAAPAPLEPVSVYDMYKLALLIFFPLFIRLSMPVGLMLESLE